VVGQKRIQKIMQRHQWQCKTPHHNAPVVIVKEP
jgi:hypothetical protein